MANKRTSLSERTKRPVDDLFPSSKENENTDTSNQVNNETSKQVGKKNDEYIRQTYYLTQHLIDSLSIYSTFEKLDKSEIIRETLENSIPEKYQEMAKNMKTSK